MKIQYNKLWKILIDKNMKKVDLRDAAEISSNSIAKLGKNEPVRMDVLMKIAAALDCKIEDLFETVKDQAEDEKNALQWLSCFEGMLHIRLVNY